MALTLRDMLKQAAKASVGEKGAESRRRLNALEAMSYQDPGKDPIERVAESDTSGYPQKTIPFGEIKSPQRVVSPNGVTMVSPGVTMVSPGDTMVTPGDTTSHQMVTPRAKPLSHQMVSPGSSKVTRLERLVLRFIEERNETTIPLKSLAKSLDIPSPTLYKIIPRLRSQGLILAEKVGNDGTYLKFISWDKVSPNGVTTSHQMVSPNGVTTSHQMVSPNGVTKSPLKIDRYKNLSISQERVELTWPILAATGFGSHQIEQIIEALTELGKPTDKIVQSLDHAEWELEQGKMLDKAGIPVADSCSWVFRSLAKTGYYRKPKGYISPEEQALLDAEETAKALLATRHRADQAQFEAWKAGLSPEEIETTMVGYVGGPKDQWLKSHWLKKYRSSDPVSM